MKKISILVFSFICAQQMFAQSANQNLSNLKAPTSINVALLPANNNKTNFGSPSKGWKNIYVDSAIYFNGTRFLASKTGTGKYNISLGGDALVANTTGADNVAAGQWALERNSDGYDNVAVGIYTLSNNTNGYYNTAVGSFSSAISSTGHHNSSFGNISLYNNKTGSFNTAIGNGAMYYSTTGSWNTCLGSVVLNHNTTGISNTAIGVAALSQSQTLSNIVAVGDSALMFLTGGARCTAVGSEAGLYTSTGADNTYLGYHAGINITSGYGNTVIGSGANIGASYYYNAMAIGYGAYSTYYNQVRIGNYNVTSIGGQVGWSTFSDERVKTDIKENVPGLKFINLLKPITYHYNTDKESSITGNKAVENSTDKIAISKMLFTGFSAQQVEKAAAQIGYDFSGVDAAKADKDLYALRYSDFVVPLVKSVQELSKQNDSLANEVAELKSMILQIQQNISANSGTNYSNAAKAIIDGASLLQNAPNPLNNSTDIKYTLPQKFSTAQIVITDMNGNQLKQFKLSNGGSGKITVDAALLSAGTYSYSLYINSILVSSKQMVIVK